MAKMTFRADDHIVEPGEWHSFKEWESLGFWIRGGEKARRFVDGVAQFHSYQVTRVSGATGTGGGCYDSGRYMYDDRDAYSDNVGPF